MTVALRGHHLLCVLTYVGKGYNQDFVENYDAIVTRLEHEEVQVVVGPDDICRPLLKGDEAHCYLTRVLRRDQHALEAVSGLLGRKVETGSRLRLNSTLISELRLAFHSGAIRLACEGCEWSDLCTSVARSEFRGACFNPDADA